MSCEHLLGDGDTCSNSLAHGALTILLRSWFGGFGGGGGPLAPAVATVACAGAGAAGCCGTNPIVVAGAEPAGAAVGLPPLLLLAAAVSLPLLDIVSGKVRMTVVPGMEQCDMCSLLSEIYTRLHHVPTLLDQQIGTAADGRPQSRFGARYRVQEIQGRVCDDKLYGDGRGCAAAWPFTQVCINSSWLSMFFRSAHTAPGLCDVGALRSVCACLTSSLPEPIVSHVADVEMRVQGLVPCMTSPASQTREALPPEVGMLNDTTFHDYFTYPK